MKKILVLLILATFYACNSDETIVIKSLVFSEDYQNRPVILHKADLPELPKYFILKANDKEIPYQIDDLDGDGNWDELFLLVDFKAGVKQNFTVSETDKEPVFKDKVGVTFAKKDAPHDNCYGALRVKPTDTVKASALFQMEGPAWENDLVGFRNYYDQRNVNDIFGKQTTELSLAKAGINGQNYHELDTWGMDILKVGTSLGAGGIALQKGDKIYRIDNPKSSSFELTIDGPLRAIFSLVHNDFKIDSTVYQINQEITIYAGTNFYESTVIINGITGDEKLVIGIVNLHSEQLHLSSSKNGENLIFATHDQQAENGVKLGMAISIKKSEFQFKQELPKEDAEITNTYAIFLKIKNNQPVTYRFTAAWENQDKKMADQEYFLKSLIE